MSKPGEIISPTRKEIITLRILILLGLFSLANFFYWFLNSKLIDNQLLYYLLIGTMAFDSLRIVYIWYLYWDISLPKKPALSKDLTVDVFTTYFPGEPQEMVKETLLAIQRINYPHTTYLCDEANDDSLRAFCMEHGIKHVTRNNRINAKAGNINNALSQAKGDICLILDPDHVPKENFLDEVVPYFEDEKIGFVQTVQSYYNIDTSLVAKGAAEQTFHFYGPIMMTMNSYGTVNAIGANCVFRRKALDSIGGHAPGLTEDMHTAMLLYAKGWKSVYVPKVLAKGLVPATLSAYYQQQLKWARGSLELLVSVYPRVFKQFTLRQKLHFGILPLHYLTGIFYLISFLIPIISLFSATTPWKGNVINFGLIIIPLFTCIIGIRFYVQRWVADKSERGTHLIGGLLLASAWWIYLVGLIYTIIRKKVLYLPTPKADKDATSWKILFPNLIVGIVSVAAVIYGLSIDFTPFSLFMSGFALFNASLMFYTLVLAYQKQKIVKFSLDPRVGNTSIFNTLQNYAYEFWHLAALPLVVLILMLFGSFIYKTEYVKWEGVKQEIREKNRINYIGVFAPKYDNGISNLKNVEDLSNQVSEKFDIISLYIPWQKNIEPSFPQLLLDSIYLQKSIPMITWEPWLNTFTDLIDNEKHVYELIEEGYFDSYILQFAEKLKNLKRPVFLRFAHEFDNQFYPWFISGNDASEKFKSAWIHTYEIFKNNDANNVIWIWNPWKSTNVASFYPGKEYVDWIGVNILNYGDLNEDGKWHDFKSLYEPFHEEFKNLPNTPVIISEFGTLNNDQKQDAWYRNAFVSIENDFDEIKSVIYFNSKVDNNWPKGLQAETNLDWTITDNQLIKNSFSSKEVPDYVFSQFPNAKSSIIPELSSIPKELKNVKGINFRTGHDWRKNYRVLSRKNILADFKKIKRLGINTIKFEGNSIYTYNLLNITKESDLNVAYGFWIPENTDFVEDTLKTEKLKQNIVSDIEKRKHYSHIVSWNILTDIQYNQKDFYLKPRLFYQNRAYVIWLNDLVNEIKTIDTTRPVFVDLEVNKLSIYHVQNLFDYVNGIDGFGLVVKDPEYLNTVIAFLNDANIDFLFSEIDAEVLAETEVFSMQKSFFITAWQDTHESNEISFDGLVDRKGRFKADYFTLLNTLQESNIDISKPIVRILKPAKLINENIKVDYHAMYYDDVKGWRPGEDVEDLSFEWSLVKCDQYGNYLAIKDIGNGPVLSLKIPKNYTFYRLLLTTSKGEVVTTTISRLNTPIVQKLESAN